MQAQPQTNYATELYVGFMRTIVPVGHITLYNPRLLVGTTSQTNLTVTVTRADGMEESTGKTSSGASTVFNLSNDLIVLNAESQFRQKGLLVSSASNPISAVAFAFDFQGATDAFLVLPCHAVLIDRADYEYFAVSFQGANGYHSEVLLTGCDDNTNVTVTPSQSISIPSDPSIQSSPLINLSPGQSHTFFLHAQQTLLISTTTSDLTGTRVTSNRPISVTSGNDCRGIPVNNANCEYLVEQIPPTATWGNVFILPPFLGRETGQFYKVVSSMDNTLVKRTCSNDSITTDFTLASAGSFEFFHTGKSIYCSLESNKPILVVQVALSFVEGDTGDPTMILVAPMDEYLQSFRFQSLPSLGTFKHYINVMVPIQHYNSTQILYDGAVNPSCIWRPVIGAGSTIIGWGCNYEISPDVTHTVRHAAPDGKLFVMVYGFREKSNVHRAYGYPAGLALDYHVRYENHCISSHVPSIYAL